MIKLGGPVDAFGVLNFQKETETGFVCGVFEVLLSLSTGLNIKVSDQEKQRETGLSWGTVHTFIFNQQSAAQVRNWRHISLLC